jgi:hypothetical protein
MGTSQTDNRNHLTCLSQLALGNFAIAEINFVYSRLRIKWQLKA